MDSEAVLQKYAHLFEMFQNERFFVAVANDEITPRQLGIFLVQDAHYLTAFGDRLRDLARFVEDAGAQSILKRHSRDADGLPDVARGIVARDLELPELASEGPRPPTREYINHQRRSVCNGIREGMLSILPCYVFYPCFVTAIRKKASESELLQKILQFVSSEEQARRWAAEILEVWNRIGLTEPSDEAAAPFALSAQYEAMLLDSAMR